MTEQEIAAIHEAIAGALAAVAASREQAGKVTDLCEPDARSEAARNASLAVLLTLECQALDRIEAQEAQDRERPTGRRTGARRYR